MASNPVARRSPSANRPASTRLAAGPFWPGGLVAHANGSLYVTMGRWCHRLSSDLRVLRTRKLARNRPYNSLVVLASGALVMKDLDRTTFEPTTLTVLDPETLEPLARPQRAPEAAIARLSASGDTVYLVGDHTISRWDWDGGELVRRQHGSLVVQRARGQQTERGAGGARLGGALPAPGGTAGSFPSRLWRCTRSGGLAGAATPTPASASTTSSTRRHMSSTRSRRPSPRSSASAGRSRATPRSSSASSSAASCW